MSRYSLTSELINNGDLMFEYNSDGFLIAFEVRAEMDNKQLLNVLLHLPKKEEDLKVLGAAKGRKLELLPDDLSFERFWEAYNYKTGKQECEKFWSKMNEADQLAAIKKIKAFQQWNSLKGYNLIYPVRYLNKRRYEDILR